MEKIQYNIIIFNWIFLESTLNICVNTYIIIDINSKKNISCNYDIFSNCKKMIWSKRKLNQLFMNYLNLFWTIMLIINIYKKKKKIGYNHKKVNIEKKLHDEIHLCGRYCSKME